MHMLLTRSYMISYNLFLEISQIVSNEPTAKITSLPYDRWLPLWKERLSMVPDLPVVPPPACKINTPLNTKNWQHCLSPHPNHNLVQYFIDGISNGFRIGISTPVQALQSANKNLQTALLQPQVVDQYLQSELTSQRISGPFQQTQCPAVQISRFGVIPKNHQPNKWRLIVDLSHPAGHSVNDNIPKALCSLTYITVDDAIQAIVQSGPHTLLSKVDIKSAFRLIPVHPADRHWLAMKWKDKIYIDGCLPFGLRSAPKLFNILADLLAWIAAQEGISGILHYLDDFLIIGPPHSHVCKQNLDTFMQLCDNLGIPLASEKIEGPSTSLSFLGICLDTACMEIRLPNDKLSRIRLTLAQWLHKKKATKREILSLVGLLQHATKVVRCGRTFIARMYATAAKVRELHFFTRLNREFKSDLAWWYAFVQHWNGLSILQSPNLPPSTQITIQTDASGSWGCGAVCNHHWLQWQWPEAWTSKDIMAKELVPVVLSCAVWAPLLTKKNVLLQCDNLSLVIAINKGSAKAPIVMHLLRCLWFFCAYFNITLTASHIPGASNTLADQLSRNLMVEFFKSCHDASRLPTLLPPPVLEIVSPEGPDWTSPSFSKLFTASIPHILSLGVTAPN